MNRWRREMASNEAISSRTVRTGNAATHNWEVPSAKKWSRVGERQGRQTLGVFCSRPLGAVGKVGSRDSTPAWVVRSPAVCVWSNRPSSNGQSRSHLFEKAEAEQPPSCAIAPTTITRKGACHDTEDCKSCDVGHLGHGLRRAGEPSYGEGHDGQGCQGSNYRERAASRSASRDASQPQRQRDHAEGRDVSRACRWRELNSPDTLHR